MQLTEILFVIGFSSLFYFCNVTKQIIEKYGNGVALVSNTQRAKKQVYQQFVSSTVAAEFRKLSQIWILELFTVQERQPMYQRWQKSTKL